MKTKTIRALSAFAKIASVITGAAAYTHLLPANLLPAAAIAFAGVSAVKEVALVIGDYTDDGKRNQSFKVPLIVLGFILCAGGLVSCATNADGEKTFWGLNASAWGEIGKAAVSGAAPVLIDEKSKATATK